MPLDGATRSEVADTLYRYAAAVDDRDLDALAAMVTADVTLVRPDGIHHGRDAFVEAYSGALTEAPSRHLITNVIATPAENEAISVRANFLALSDAGTGTRLAWGHYRDEFVRAGDVLLFRRKENHVDRAATVPDAAASESLL